MESSERQWIVAQLGARMEYGVAKALYQAGQLGMLYTDFYLSGWQYGMISRCMLGIQHNLSMSMRSRSMELPDSKVLAFNLLGLRYRYKLKQAKNQQEALATFIWAGQQLGRLSAKRILSCQAVYGFNTACLEILQEARKLGMFTVVEQCILPKALETEILTVEHDSHPGWEKPLKHNSSLTEYCHREEEEWKWADRIICGSEFVKSGVISRGGEENKCAVIPYGVNVHHDRNRASVREEQESNKLKVLTIGTICLRKGYPYLLEAAKALGSQIQFKVIGSNMVSDKMLNLLSKHVDYLGPLPSDQVAKWYQWADVFLLPTLVEGSATVTYEAIAHGLPVITTANCGSLIEDQVDGMILPIRDADAIIAALLRLVKEPELLEHLTSNARDKLAEVSHRRYARKLLDELNNTGNI